MNPRLASDSDFSTSGTVVSLVRGKTDVEGITAYENTLVTLVLASASNSQIKHRVDLPICTASDFDLIPYQAALIGESVAYQKIWREWDEGRAQVWTLQVNSGPLSGSEYRHTKA